MVQQLSLCLGNNGFENFCEYVMTLSFMLALHINLRPLKDIYVVCASLGFGATPAATTGTSSPSRHTADSRLVAKPLIPTFSKSGYLDGRAQDLRGRLCFG